jgi:putative ABC transport system permease protein
MAHSRRRDRVFAGLLKLFPSEFRGDFGDELRADFNDQEAAARRASPRAVVALWVRTLWDFVRRGPREHLDVLLRDARYGLRVLWRRPALAASAFVTLAVGIGLNTAAFSVVNGVLLRQLPYPSADRLVRIFEVSPPPEQAPTDVSPGNFVDWAAETRTLDGIGLYGGRPGTLIAQSDPEWIYAMAVSQGLLDMLATPPMLGRLFVPGDFDTMRAYYRIPGAERPDDAPAPRAIILSYELWQRQFAGRSDVIGTSARFAGAPVDIVGVMPRGFGFTDTGWGDPAVAWVPDVADPLQRRARYRRAIGRLAPGVSIEAAKAEFDLIAGRLASAYPRANAGRSILLTNLLDVTVADARTLLWLLFGAAAAVLLIACANVANLLLAHASGRRLELATRMALGASRGHLVRQTITESMCLGGIAGAGGLLMAYLALPWLLRFAPPELPRVSGVSIDFRVLMFSFGLSLAVGLACGLIACVSVTRDASARVSRSTGADAAFAGRRVRHTLAIAEIALALILVVAAGLLVRTMRAVGALPLGFNPRGVISVGLSGSTRDFARAGAVSSDLELVTRVRALPGVVAAGIGSRPLGAGMGTVIRPSGDETRQIDIGVDSVSPGYLEALGGALVAGRFFDARDTAAAVPVAILNVSAAQHFWSGQSAVGRMIETPGEKRFEVVGVVGDVRRRGLEESPGPTVYFPSVQATNFRINNLLVRTTGDPGALAPALRAILRQIDPEQALVRIQTLEETLRRATAPRRFTLQLVGVFSLVALALAMVGIYGIVAESVARRVPEIGIRMALGATSRNVMALILRQGAWMLAMAVPLGLAGALAMRGVIASFLFGVQPGDPQSYALATMALVVTTLAACAIPAWRAATIDPVTALRQE